MILLSQIIPKKTDPYDQRDEVAQEMMRAFNVSTGLDPEVDGWNELIEFLYFLDNAVRGFKGKDEIDLSYLIGGRFNINATGIGVLRPVVPEDIFAND